MLMIFMATVHGFNGLRMVLEDYIKSPLVIAFLRGLTLLVLIAAIIVAIYVVLAS
jgi:succinate dehydrogenase hydrophobic anchor subunit